MQEPMEADKSDLKMKKEAMGQAKNWIELSIGKYTLEGTFTSMDEVDNTKLNKFARELITRYVVKKIVDPNEKSKAKFVSKSAIEDERLKQLVEIARVEKQEKTSREIDDKLSAMTEDDLAQFIFDLYIEEGPDHVLEILEDEISNRPHLFTEKVAEFIKGKVEERKEEIRLREEEEAEEGVKWFLEYFDGLSKNDKSKGELVILNEVASDKLSELSRKKLKKIFLEET